MRISRKVRIQDNEVQRLENVVSVRRRRLLEAESKLQRARERADKE